MKYVVASLMVLPTVFVCIWWFSANYLHEVIGYLDLTDFHETANEYCFVGFLVLEVVALIVASAAISKVRRRKA